MVNLCCGIKYVREVLPKRFAGVRRVELRELISKKRKQINLITIKVLNAGHVEKNPFALKSRLLDARLPFLFFQFSSTDPLDIIYKIIVFWQCIVDNILSA